jgi:microsomal dipeptidase-like Zn-dependent dipeptidase
MSWIKTLAVGATLLVVIGLGLSALLGPAAIERSQNRVVEHPPWQVSQAARERHAALTIVDWHSDSLLWNRNLLERADYGHVDVPRLAEGNVAVQMFTAVTKSPAGQNYERNSADSDNITSLTVVQLWPPATWSSLTERALYQARRLHDFAAEAPERLRVVRSRRELDEALEQRARARENGAPPLVIGLLGIEGAHALEGRLENLQSLYDAGYRMVALHHFFDNELGGSFHGASREGLSDFGRAVVRRLDELRIIVDVAHSSPAVVDDVLKQTSRPVVVSHTGLHGHCATARNLEDEQLQRIAARGGLIGIGYWAGAICDVSPAGVVSALRYAIDLVGEDRVALGSDFDGSTTTLFDTSELAILTQTMLDARFSNAEIEKVMGGNSVRFLREQLPGS